MEVLIPMCYSNVKESSAKVVCVGAVRQMPLPPLSGDKACLRRSQTCDAILVRTAVAVQ